MTPRLAVCVLAALAVVLGAGRLASGQSARERLAAVTRLECRFAAVATGTWSEDGARASVAVAPAELAASFANIDTRAGTAEAVSRFGRSFIVVRHADDYLHLLQQIDIGPLYVTTVMAQETAGGRLMAVHTRHEFAASSYPEFRERPEMYIGDCAT